MVLVVYGIKKTFVLPKELKHLPVLRKVLTKLRTSQTRTSHYLYRTNLKKSIQTQSLILPELKSCDSELSKTELILFISRMTNFIILLQHFSFTHMAVVDDNRLQRIFWILRACWSPTKSIRLQNFRVKRILLCFLRYMVVRWKNLVFLSMWQIQLTRDLYFHYNSCLLQSVVIFSFCACSTDLLYCWLFAVWVVGS